MTDFSRISNLELFDELKSRGKDTDPDIVSWYELYELKYTNNPNFEKVFADIIYHKIGKIL